MKLPPPSSADPEQQQIRTQLLSGQDPIQLERADAEASSGSLPDRQLNETDEKSVTTKAAEELADIRCLTGIGDYAGAIFNRLKGTNQFNGLHRGTEAITAARLQECLTGHCGEDIKARAVQGLIAAAAFTFIDIRTARYAVDVYAERNLTNHSQVGTANGDRDVEAVERSISDDLAELPNFLSWKFLPHQATIRDFILEFEKTNPTMHPERQPIPRTSERCPLPPVYFRDYLKHYRQLFSAEDIFPPDSQVVSLDPSTRHRSRSMPADSREWLRKRQREFSADDHEPSAKRPKTWTASETTDKPYPESWNIDPGKVPGKQTTETARAYLRQYFTLQAQLSEMVDNAVPEDEEELRKALKNIQENILPEVRDKMRGAREKAEEKATARLERDRRRAAWGSR